MHEENGYPVKGGAPWTAELVCRGLMT